MLQFTFLLKSGLERSGDAKTHVHHHFHVSPDDDKKKKKTNRGAQTPAKLVDSLPPAMQEIAFAAMNLRIEFMHKLKKRCA